MWPSALKSVCRAKVVLYNRFQPTPPPDPVSGFAARLSTRVKPASPMARRLTVVPIRADSRGAEGPSRALFGAQEGLGAVGNETLCTLIGIGTAVPPLPHHRAYGSVADSRIKAGVSEGDLFARVVRPPRGLDVLAFHASCPSYLRRLARLIWLRLSALECLNSLTDCDLLCRMAVAQVPLRFPQEFGTRHRSGKLGEPRSTRLALDGYGLRRCSLADQACLLSGFWWSRFCNPRDTTCPCALLILHLHQVGEDFHFPDEPRSAAGRRARRQSGVFVRLQVSR